MKLFLDTHIILWALDDIPKLPDEARTLIMDMKNEIYVKKWGTRWCQLWINM